MSEIQQSRGELRLRTLYGKTLVYTVLYKYIYGVKWIYTKKEDKFMREILTIKPNNMTDAQMGGGELSSFSRV